MPLLRFYRERPVTPPTREISDYSTEEQTRLQQSFVAVTVRYRLHQLIAALIFGVVFLWMIALARLPNPFFPWGAFSVGLGMFLAVGALSTGPRLVCPGCDNEIDVAARRMGHYCPECGSRELQRGDWLHDSTCKSCGRVMYRSPNAGR